MTRPETVLVYSTEGLGGCRQFFIGYIENVCVGEIQRKGKAGSFKLLGRNVFCNQ